MSRKTSTSCYTSAGGITTRLFFFVECAIPSGRDGSSCGRMREESRAGIDTSLMYGSGSEPFREKGKPSQYPFIGADVYGMQNCEGTGRYPDLTGQYESIKLITGIGKDAINWFHAEMKPVSWRKWIPGNGKLGIHPFGQEKTDGVNCGKRASWVGG